MTKCVWVKRWQRGEHNLVNDGLVYQHLQTRIVDGEGYSRNCTRLLVQTASLRALLPLVNQRLGCIIVPGLADVLVQVWTCSALAQCQLTLGWLQPFVVELAQSLPIQKRATARRNRRRLPSVAPSNGWRQDIHRAVVRFVEPPIQHQAVGQAGFDEALDIVGRRPARSAFAHGLAFGA